jgi:hypothetical protein
MPPGDGRALLLEKARDIEAAAAIDRWLSDPNGRLPH